MSMYRTCRTCLHVHHPPEDYQGSPDDLYCPRLREEVAATNGCEDWEAEGEEE